jgi:membrane-associated protease RseP (regulator of RpoE activity)
MTSQGWSQLIDFLIGLNIVLGVFNLIPLLPFDGGHVAIAVYEKAQEMRRRTSRRYMADVSRMLPVAYGVIMVLVLLTLAAGYLDVTKGVGT